MGSRLVERAVRRCSSSSEREHVVKADGRFRSQISKQARNLELVPLLSFLRSYRGGQLFRVRLAKESPPMILSAT
jgi:hypothetical protein